MPEWKICITGDDSYIKDLAKAFSYSDLTFEKDPDGWLVSGGWLSNYDTEEACREAAEAWLTALNGAAALLGGCSKAITLKNVVFERDDGSKQVFMRVRDSIKTSDSLRYTIQRENGEVEEYYPAKDLPTWLDLASEDPNIQLVLELMASGDWGWVNIYRILEVVRADLGGERNLLDLGFVTKATLTRFSSSANNPEVAGHDARHGQTKNEPPKNPMNLQEAASVVKALVHQWISVKMTGG